MVVKILKFPDGFATKLVARLRGCVGRIFAIRGTAKDIPSKCFAHPSKGGSANEMAAEMTDVDLPCPASDAGSDPFA